MVFKSFIDLFVFTVAERSAHQSPKFQYCVWRMSLLQQGNIQLYHTNIAKKITVFKSTIQFQLKYYYISSADL